jgi:hypothetical protein
MEIPDILKNKWVQMASASVVAFGIGGGVGYILGKRKEKLLRYGLDAVMQELAKEKLQHPQESMFVGTASDFYIPRPDLVVKREEFPSLYEDKKTTLYIPMSELTVDEPNEPEDMPDEYPNVVEMKRPNPQELTVDVPAYVLTVDEPQYDPETVVERFNVFSVEDADWNYEAELSTREPNEPYVIHAEEYFADEMDFRQETLTYYDGDDIMTDSEDSPIFNYAGLLGELKFGHGSRSVDIVYIRNEKLHMEWEVIKNHGAYAEEILGLEFEREDAHELKHSVLKFRRE